MRALCIKTKKIFMELKKSLIETILAFPIVFGMFHFFIFSLWLYWPIAPEIPLVLSSAILLLCYKRMEWFVPFPLHNRNKKEPSLLHKLIELPFWYVITALLYLHLSLKFDLSTQLEQNTGKILFWGYGAFFLIALTISPLSHYILKLFSRFLSKLKEIPYLIERVLSIFSVYVSVAIVFSALFRYQSVWNPGAFNKPIETTLDSFYFSVVTMTTLGYGDIFPISNVAKILVIIEVLLGIMLLAIMVGTAISVTFHEISNEKEQHNNEIQPTPKNGAAD
jgi:hypothetical protein